jgi:TRAP-type C4-dicarboxylate transport system permease small subunit
MVLDSLVVFCSLFVCDFAWSYYINNVKEGSAFKAASWALFLFIVGAIGVTTYVHNQWLIIPAAMGAFLGTYVGVKRQGD